MLGHQDEVLMQVVETEEYQKWMAGFGSAAKHIHVNSKAVRETYPLPSPATLQVSHKFGLRPLSQLGTQALSHRGISPPLPLPNMCGLL